jgi:hypothetical protein
MDRLYRQLKQMCRSSRVGVYDETILLVSGEVHLWERGERLYRQLKQNYEDQRDYERASDFHYGEKEMRRRSPGTPRGLKALLWLYKVASGYGEHVLPPLLWLVGLLVVATLTYLEWGLVPKNATSQLDWKAWPEVLHYSIRIMLLLRPDDFVPTG